MNKAVILAAAALLAGCVTHKPVSLPNGEQGFAIRCPGTARDISDCMNHAAKICGGAYEPIETEKTSTGGVMMPMGNNAMLMSGVNRTLIVRCIGSS